MRKKDLEEKLETMLEDRTQLMVEAAQKGDYSLYTMWFGCACGIIDSMRVAGFLDWDQVEEKKDQLMKKRQDA